MWWARGRSGNFSEHLFLGSLSSPGPTFVPKSIVWNRAWGWQSSADMENLTLSHQVYKSSQYWEDNSPIFCQGLPKALILHSQRGLQRDKDRSQTSGEMGARQAVLHWGRIMSTNPVLVPAAWLLSWWCCMGIRDIDDLQRQMLHEARLPFHHADARMNVVARILLLLGVAVGGRFVSENHFSLLSHPSVLMHSQIPGSCEAGEGNGSESVSES